MNQKVGSINKSFPSHKTKQNTHDYLNETSICVKLTGNKKVKLFKLNYRLCAHLPLWGIVIASEIQSNSDDLQHLTFNIVNSGRGMFPQASEEHSFQVHEPLQTQHNLLTLPTRHISDFLSFTDNLMHGLVCTTFLTLHNNIKSSHFHCLWKSPDSLFF